MNTLVVYDSQYGNTERLAQVITDTLGAFGQAQAVHVDPVQPISLQGVDLLIVAGPTQRQRMSSALRELFERLPRKVLKDMPAAAFDTRYRMSRFLSGSAAADIAHRLKREGARLIVPPESFFMQRDVPPQGEKRRHEMERLEPGEEQRAVDWALSILEYMGVTHKVDAAR
jgi:flavodoxin